jgi:hypothetical protein
MMAAKENTVRGTLNGVTVVTSEENAKRLGSVFVPEGARKAEGYAAMKVADLKAEIESRNEGRDEDDLLSVEGRKDDLVASLEADDASKSD